jgi:LysM repeat protein
MKRISIFLMAALLVTPIISRGQDAATEERFNKLSAQMDVLIEAKDLQNKRIDELTKQVRELQEQVNKPSANYATPEDLKQLAAKVKEVDEKRVQDNEGIVKAIEKLGKTLGSGASSVRKPSAASATPPNTGGTTTPLPSEGFEYSVQSGDTLGAIVKAYRDKNIKVTVQQILNANPGLKPESMKVGQKIFIPAPAQ